MPEFETKNNKKYEIKAIQKTVIYVKKNKWAPTRAILFSCIEKLFGRKKYLESIFSSQAFLEDDQHLLQRLSGKTNNNISTPELYFIYGKANSSALRKVETRTCSKK